MKQQVVSLVSKLTADKVRGQRFAHGSPSLRWWWTPWTYRFGHGGWIFLSASWFARFRNGA